MSPTVLTDTADQAVRRRPRALHAAWVGIFFVWTGGIHVGIVASDPGFYRHFADGALVPGLPHAWAAVFMPRASLLGIAIAAGEVCAGMLLLGPRPARRVGWTCVICFHVALMPFGWGFWLWSVPALALLVPAALVDQRSPVPAAPSP